MNTVQRCSSAVSYTHLDSVDSETCLRTIKETFDRYDYLIDPHTAVAMKVANNLRGENPVVIASTAHWAKFGDNVYRDVYKRQVLVASASVKVIHGSLPQDNDPANFKTCPICGSVCFADMDTCFG